MFIVDFDYENYEGRAPLCFKDYKSALSYAKKLINKILDLEVNYYHYSENNIKLNPTRGTIGSLNDNKKCIVGYSLTRKDDVLFYDFTVVRYVPDAAEIDLDQFDFDYLEKVKYVDF